MFPTAIHFPDIGPELFAIDIGTFNFALRWYALAYLVGILIGWQICVGAVKKPAFWPKAGPPLTPARSGIYSRGSSLV